MSLKSFVATAGLVFASLLSVAHGQGLPSKPITIVVPFPSGGAADATTRIVAQQVTELLKQPVIVDNRPGGGGQIAASLVKQATADGATLFLANSATYAANAALYTKLSYNPEKDFSPVIAMLKIPQLLVVPASSTVQSVKDLIAAAKANPGAISFASQSVGTGGHIAAEVLRSKNGLELMHVPYKGSALALQDLVAARVHFMFDAMPSSMPFVKDKRLRALAIDAPSRSPLLPEVPTLIELGLIGYEASPWFGIAAPAGTPIPAINRLNSVFSEALKQPEVVSKLSGLGVEVVGGTPADFGQLIKSDSARLGRVIRDANIRLD